VKSPSKNRHYLATFFAGAFFTAFLSTTRAGAEPPHLEISSGVEGCPSAEELRKLIVGQLGHDDFDRADSPSVTVRVRKSVTDGTSSADVSVTTSMTTTRTIEGDSCTDVVRAAALSVALAIEKEEAEKKPPPPPITKEDDRSGGVSIRRDRVAITGSALTTVGLLPRPAAGAGVGARVRVSESTWLSARGFVLPGASMPNDSFALNLIAGGPGACVEPFGSTSVAMTGCAHVLLGSFDVTKTSVDMTNDKAEFFSAMSLSAGARARVAGPLHLEGAIDAQLPFTRPTWLTTTCPPTGFEPAFVALAVWLGAGISIR
jgi:hypothetical protein